MSKSIAERIEALGPCREMDQAIHEAMGLPMTEWRDGGHSMPGYSVDIEPPHYTASLDAAMTLAEECADPEEVMDQAIRALKAAHVPMGQYFKAMPRFVCAAALRAQGATNG